MSDGGDKGELPPDEVAPEEETLRDLDEVRETLMSRRAMLRTVTSKVAMGIAAGMGLGFIGRSSRNEARADSGCGGCWWCDTGCTGCTGCWGGCTGSCFGICTAACGFGCSTSCDGGCTGSCQGGCEGSCDGTCRTGCDGTCFGFDQGT